MTRSDGKSGRWIIAQARWEMSDKDPGFALVTYFWAGRPCKEPPDSTERLLRWEPWWCGTAACQEVRASDEQERLLATGRRAGGQTGRQGRVEGEKKKKNKWIKLFSCHFFNCLVLQQKPSLWQRLDGFIPAAHTILSNLNTGPQTNNLYVYKDRDLFSSNLMFLEWKQSRSAGKLKYGINFIKKTRFSLVCNVEALT